MIYPIVRLYASAQEANTAISRVRACGLPGNQINLVAPSADAKLDDVIAAIKAGKVLAAHARIYAEQVLRGLWLVSVDAPGGTGRMYTNLLESANPVESGISDTTPGRAWDEATPLSCIFALPVISKPSPYAFLGFRAVLPAGRTTFSCIGLPEIASSSLAIFGSPRLSRNPAPFSSLFHLPLIR